MVDGPNEIPRLAGDFNRIKEYVDNGQVRDAFPG